MPWPGPKKSGPAGVSQTFTAEFRDEIEAERAGFLRERVLVYCTVVMCIKAMGLVAVLLAQFVGERVFGGPWPIAIVKLLFTALGIAVYGGAYRYVSSERLSKEKTLDVVYWLIVISGCLGMISQLTTSAMESTAEQTNRQIVVFDVLATHFLACCFLPWTVREAVRPLAPLLIVNAVLTIVQFHDRLVWGLVSILLSPLVGVPGLLIAAWKHSRFHERAQNKVLRGRYGEIRRELVDARRIHEDLFPSPLLEGPVRFDYRYEPMRQIGGDYLYARRSGGAPESPNLNVIIVDVTGHGITAALTVNRLHGEIERQLGERPDIGPGEILRGLNSYIHLTLADHSIYATVLCLQADGAAHTLRWASAGHPSAFLRAVDGTVHRLDSTTLVLGACHGDDFIPEEQHIPFGPGDVVIAYTDGAIECRDARGRQLQTAGLERIVAGVPRTGSTKWCNAIISALDEWRVGAAQDDTLIVELWRPLSTSAV